MFKLSLSVILVTYTSIALANPISFSGRAHNSDFKSYAITSIDALQQFGFRYETDDHQLSAVELLPTSSGVRAGFRDKNGDDYFTWQAHYSKPVVGSPITTGQVSGECNGYTCTRILDLPQGPSDFVITGFKFNYGSGNDHKVKGLGIVENNGQLKISYYDANGDDDFSYIVNYAYVPRVGRSSVSENEGQGRGQVAFALPRALNFISGFTLSYQGAFDNNIQEIGVELQSGNGLVTFHDKDSADLFRYKVKTLSVR